LQHIFDRLDVFGIYEEDYLQPYKAKLEEIDKILSVDSKSHALPETVMEVLRYKYAKCSK
jgi:hypothetical protein